MSARFARIVTPRLVLHPPSEADPEEIADGIGNYEVARWLGRVPYPYRSEDARAFLDASVGKDGQVWFVHDADGLCGGISVDPELGYWLARDVWGQGYATEAGDAVVDAHFADPDAGELTSGYFLGNDRSAAVLAKLGFRETGLSEIRARALSQRVTRQDVVMTRSDWIRRRQLRIDTPRLRLRVVAEADRHQLQRICGDPDVARLIPSIALPLTEAMLRHWILRARFVGRPGYGLAMELRGSAVIGAVALGPQCAVETIVDRRHWNAGYATEALRGLLADCGARFPDLAAVTADHFLDTPASGRVLEKLGFERVGTGRAQSSARKGRAPTALYRLPRHRFPVAP